MDCDTVVTVVTVHISNSAGRAERNSARVVE